MIKLIRGFILVAALPLASCGGGSGSNSSVTPRIGTISYWSISSLYDQLPSGSIAVVNPTNGILTGQTTSVTPDVSSYVSIVSAAAARNVAMLGYVPTGYFSHGCNTAEQCQTWARISAQVQTYFQYMPDLAGIFFDEASPKVWSCGAFLAEYQQLREIVHQYRPGAKIAFNAAVPDNCVVDGVAVGEIVVLFESNPTAYLNQSAAVHASTASALAKGAIPWHLVYAVATDSDLNTVIAQAISSRTALFYATDKSAGSNTWGTLPAYWQLELSLLGY